MKRGRIKRKNRKYDRKPQEVDEHNDRDRNQRFVFEHALHARVEKGEGLLKHLEAVAGCNKPCSIRIHHQREFLNAPISTETVCTYDRNVTAGITCFAGCASD